MAVKKEVLLAITIIIFLSVLVFSFTYNDLEQVFLSPDYYFFTSTDEYCSLAMPFNKEEGACFAVTPGFWKNRICKRKPQSMSDEVVDEYLYIIRQNSAFFSGLTSRNKACTYLKKNNPEFERARKFFLANMFNFASGGITLSTPIDSEYSFAPTFADVIQESDDVLINYKKNKYELQRIGDLNEDICAYDATSCSHEFDQYGSDVCIDCTTPCKEYEDFRDTFNHIKKLEHNVMLIPLSVESLYDEPIFSFYDDYFVLNDFTLTLGFFSWDTTNSGTLSDYQNIFNNNEITHQCSGCNCTTEIIINTDCNFYINRTIFHFWYWFERKDGPDDPLKKAVYSIIKPIFFSFLEDGELSKNIKVYPDDQDSFSIDFGLDIDDLFIDIITSTSPYSMPYGLFNSVISLGDSAKPLYMLIVNEEIQETLDSIEEEIEETQPSSSSSSSSSGSSGGGSSSSNTSTRSITIIPEIVSNIEEQEQPSGKSGRSRGNSGSGRLPDQISSSESTTSVESGSSGLYNNLRASVIRSEEGEPVSFTFESKLNFAILFSILIVGFYFAKEYFPLDNIHYKIRKKLFK